MKQFVNAIGKVNPSESHYKKKQNNLRNF